MQEDVDQFARRAITKCALTFGKTSIWCIGRYCTEMGLLEQFDVFGRPRWVKQDLYT